MCGVIQFPPLPEQGFHRNHSKQRLEEGYLKATEDRKEKNLAK